jgi:hypothetical protein
VNGCAMVCVIIPADDVLALRKLPRKLTKIVASRRTNSYNINKHLQVLEGG